MVTNQQSKEQREAIENAATTILAYLDMGNKEEVERLLTTTDRHSLGLIIATWYQICVAHRGIKVTVNAAAKVMEFLTSQSILETRHEEEAAADKYAASLLFHLNDNAMDRFAKAWDRAINHTPEISSDVAARMLGFIRGMLIDIPAPEGM